MSYETPLKGLPWHQRGLDLIDSAGCACLPRYERVPMNQMYGGRRIPRSARAEEGCLLEESLGYSCHRWRMCWSRAFERRGCQGIRIPSRGCVGMAD